MSVMKRDPHHVLHPSATTTSSTELTLQVLHKYGYADRSQQKICTGVGDELETASTKYLNKMANSRVFLIFPVFRDWGVVDS